MVGPQKRVSKVRVMYKGMYLLLLASSVIYSFDYDVIVIGGGSAGIEVARIASDLDIKVAIIEKGQLGGSSIRYGDLPSKLLARLSALAYKVNSLSDIYSVSNRNEAHWSMKPNKNFFDYIKKRVQEVSGLRLDFLEKSNNVKVLYGVCSFIDSHTVRVGGKTYRGNHIIVATGSHPLVEEIDGIQELDSSRCCVADTFFDLEEIPRSVVIVGGGATGVEFATALNRLGCKVTLVMRHPMILPFCDFEVVNYLMQLMVEEGITLLCRHSVTSVEKTAKGIRARCLSMMGDALDVEAELIFVAAGRRPNLAHLNLDAAKVSYNSFGIKVDEYLRTTAENIYACGDAADSTNLKLTRLAYYHARTVMHNICKTSLFNPPHDVNYLNVSRVVYGCYTLAHAGLTEQDARRLYGNKIRIYKYPYQSIDKAYVEGTTKGMAKFICSYDGRLIGVHILGDFAEHLVDAMRIGASFDDKHTNGLDELRVSPSYFDLAAKAVYDAMSDVRIPWWRTQLRALGDWLHSF